MVIEFTKFVDAISCATDFVEAELLHVPHYHEKRVAVLVNKMGQYLDVDKDVLYAITIAGAMHDCALTEYLQDELSGQDGIRDERNMGAHCRVGEDVMRKYPFYDKMEGAVLYHHETADGKGVHGLLAGDTPLGARMIHIADVADNRFRLSEIDQEKHTELLDWVKRQEGTLFDSEVVRAFCLAADYDTLVSISGENVIQTLDEILPPKMMDIPISILRDLSEFFANTTDYKSHFTWRHSLGVAEKAEEMGRYYGYSEEHCQKLYIAGALHDIGKLLISNDILEKPGRLSPEEYQQIQNHSTGTWDLLHSIGGMEDIARWSSLHHEKLDGSGYPFGFTADELGHEERLMACIDIYQALVEERPYKAGLPHGEAMEIIRKMGTAGQLDREIIEDVDRCFGGRTEESAAESSTVEEAPEHEGEAWRCPVCGYILEGPLPEDFICPRCEQPGTIFERVSD